MENEVRVDKWLWAVRVFKSRSMATSACKSGKVFIDDIPVKPSRNIRKDDIILVKKPPLSYTFKVLDVLNNRVGAPKVPDYMENLTPQEELNKLKMSREQLFYYREKGTGRPTKKERRLLDSINFDEEEEDI